MPSLKNVIYISGSGRSGSTLLERIFHSSDQVTGLGEFHCLWRLAEQEITCSCGAPFLVDGFWKSVMEEAGLDAGALADLRRLESQVCRTGFIARHRFSLESLRGDAEVRRFVDLQFRLFEAVVRVSGSRVVVDSSKAGPRAWLLACDPRVRIIHLYRDPADVIVSWRSGKFDPGLGQEMKRMPISTAALDWWKVEQLLRRLAKEVPVARIDYRRLCAAPQATVEAAFAALRLETRLAPRWAGHDTIEQGQDYHSLNGNPDRFDRAAIRISARGAAWHQVKARERPAILLAAAALRVLHPNRAWPPLLQSSNRRGN